jgi:import inner membrane translocase subunit TIM23
MEYEENDGKRFRQQIPYQFPNQFNQQREPAKKKPNYVHIDGVSGRDVFSRMAYDTGLAWGLGIVGGGSLGVIQGVRAAPSSNSRVMLNSVLNASGKGGSRAGNALGVLTILYVSAEWVTEKVERETIGSLPFSDTLVPTIAGGVMGTLYKSTKGPKTAALAGVIGAVACGSYRVAGNYVPALVPQLAFLF